MKYFYLQYKKLIRTLPFILIISAILLGTVSAVMFRFSDFLKSERESRIKIAVVGEADSRMFDMGISALKTMDPSRYSIDIELTDEDTAKSDLLSGRISAYIVIPEQFMKAAQKGETLPITYCTTASAVDVSALMRDEITKVISVMLKESQKGAFGEERMLRENGYKKLADNESTELALKYADFIVDRSKMYKTDVTGVSYGLDLIGHLFIGFTVIFLCITVIPVICRTVRRDNGMVKMLCAAGKGPAYSVLCEYAAVFCVFITALTFLGLAVYISVVTFNIDVWGITGADMGRAVFRLVLIAAMVCAFAFFASEAGGNIFSTVICYFFLSMGLCYISGCMYPLYALPASLQKIAAYTPTGAARAYISLFVTGENATGALFTLLAYTVLFLAAAVIIRKLRLSKGEG